MSAAELDLFDVRRALGAPGLLRTFNDIGVLSAADVHVATRIAALAGEEDETLVLAAALAVRAPRLGHVFVDLATIRDTATVDAEEPVDLSGLPWPDVAPWLSALAASPLTDGPLHLEDTALYLDRYWREEVQIAADLTTLAAPADAVALDVLRGGVTRLFAGEAAERQALAAAAAVLRRFAVVAGGPGTGKTTTVARIVALLAEQATAGPSPTAAADALPLVALAAPTGKAAARLEEAVHAEAVRLDVDDAVQDFLLGLSASTLHRLLGWRPDSHSRFRHDRLNRLPHDVVIVDETSMVSLSLMARLVEAVRPDARLILVGDPGQLTSIEAGAVLGDIVGPATAGLRMGRSTQAALEEVTGAALDAQDAPFGDGIVVLDRTHRYGSAIGAVAGAIRRGATEETLAALAAAPDTITWVDVDAAASDDGLEVVRDEAVGTARRVTAAARAGDAEAALGAAAAFRLLCAHRHGPYGVERWTAQIEAWLADTLPGFGAEGAWYPGRPLLVTENDYGVGLFNGDTGVVVTADGRTTAAFERRGEIARFSPARLSAVETVYAMTVHKSQGSQFGTAAVLLPDPQSPLLTRELLYTAVTRARERLVLVGTADAVRAAVGRPVARASGLGRRLWHERPG